MSFYDTIRDYDWNEVLREIESRTPADVEKALGEGMPSSDHLMSLLSPAADKCLEEMAQKAHRITEQRFGKIISLFAPLYLSNECTNQCVYCGFNACNAIERRTLTPQEAFEEGKKIHGLGFRHLLLVSGEAPALVPPQYFAQTARLLRPLFSSMAVEVYPMATEEYSLLVDNGVDGLVIYQETYNRDCYDKVHPAGKKRDYLWRMETPERGGRAGFRRLGLGALLGLSDWRAEAFFLGLHARYLLRKYWMSHVTVSFPRLRPAAGAYEPAKPVSDRELVQMVTALRILLPDVGLILSTRENPHFRDHLIPLGITSMSAGSRTEPGGYTHAHEAEAQFQIADERSPEEFAEVIRQKGYEPVWKDWDAVFMEGDVA